MGLGVVITLSTVTVICLYLVFHALFSNFAKNEIAKSHEIRHREQTFEIYANAESLEFYIRMAMASEPKTKIIVNINTNCAEAGELEFIAAKFAHKVGNLKIRYIN